MPSHCYNPNIALSWNRRCQQVPINGEVPGSAVFGRVAFDRSDGSISSSFPSVSQLKFAVIGNPLKRCGVHLAAVQQARVLNCPFLTEPSRAEGYDFAYVHWHPNFLWQHQNWVAELRKLDIPIVLIVHDYIMIEPVRNPIAFVAFDRKAVPISQAIEIPMPLQQPYPFIPRTQPDPDLIGFFGFYGSTKGCWTILAYARKHKRKARFITTLHPFAPHWLVSEFEEFVSTAKRLGMEIIDEWLEGQELADAMGECGFFVVKHSAGGLGASASVTSPLAAKRPVYSDRRNPFLKSSANFVLQFHFAHYPTPEELEEASKLIDDASKALSPTEIWTSLHCLLTSYTQDDIIKAELETGSR
jgi:hypothetical protein